MVLEDADMSDGEFIYMFQINSIFGDEDYGDPIYMELKDGELSVYEE